MKKYSIQLVLKELEEMEKDNKNPTCVPLRDYPISTMKILGMKEGKLSNGKFKGN